MKYLIWMVCWVISQRIMMAMGVIYEKPLTSSIFSAVISTIIVLWVILCFENGNVINGLVGGAMNAWLIRIALKKKTGA